MQTFLPYASYAESAKALDNKRLGKQRVETLQVFQVLLGERLVTSDKVVKQVSVKDNDGEHITVDRVTKVPRPREAWDREPVKSKGWTHHPAVMMWRGHELELLKYQEAICAEWTDRGFRDSCLEKTHYLLAPHMDELKEGAPSFIGNEDFHTSHKSNLIRKDEDHYAKQWDGLNGDLPYLWPVTAASTGDQK